MSHINEIDFVNAMEFRNILYFYIISENNLIESFKWNHRAATFEAWRRILILLLVIWYACNSFCNEFLVCCVFDTFISAHPEHEMNLVAFQTLEFTVSIKSGNATKFPCYTIHHDFILLLYDSSRWETPI